MLNTIQQENQGKPTKRSIRNSIERVDSYLQGKEFVAITQIAQDLKLQFRSVKKCLETLEKLGRIEIATNGNISLVKTKFQVGVHNAN